MQFVPLVLVSVLMDRDLLYFRLSLIWLALVASGAVYVLIKML